MGAALLVAVLVGWVALMVGICQLLRLPSDLDDRDEDGGGGG